MAERDHSTERHAFQKWNESSEQVDSLVKFTQLGSHKEKPRAQDFNHTSSNLSSTPPYCPNWHFSFFPNACFTFKTENVSLSLVGQTHLPYSVSTHWLEPLLSAGFSQVHKLITLSKQNSIPLILPPPQVPPSLLLPSQASFLSKCPPSGSPLPPPSHSSMATWSLLLPLLGTPLTAGTWDLSPGNAQGPVRAGLPAACDGDVFPCDTLSSQVLWCQLFGASFFLSLITASLPLWVGRVVRHGWVDLARDGGETQPPSHTAFLDILHPPPQVSSPALPSFTYSSFNICRAPTVWQIMFLTLGMQTWKTRV